MPVNAFRIVSRESGKALAVEGDFAAQTPICQSTQTGVGDDTQVWTLAPRMGSITDFFILSASHPELAIWVDRRKHPDPTQKAPLYLETHDEFHVDQVWRISRIANPPYFFLLEADNDLLMDVRNSSHDEGEIIQVFPRHENNNQQWTFLPVFDLLQ